MNYVNNQFVQEIVMQVAEKRVAGYSEAELLCEMLGDEGCIEETQNICRIVNETSTRLYLENYGAEYEDEEELEENLPAEMTDISEIRQYIVSYYDDFAEDAGEELQQLLYTGRNRVIRETFEVLGVM